MKSLNYHCLYASHNSKQCCLEITENYMERLVIVKL